MHLCSALPHVLRPREYLHAILSQTHASSPVPPPPPASRPQIVPPVPSIPQSPPRTRPPSAPAHPPPPVAPQLPAHAPAWTPDTAPRSDPQSKLLPMSHRIRVPRPSRVLCERAGILTST